MKTGCRSTKHTKSIKYTKSLTVKNKKLTELQNAQDTNREMVPGILPPRLTLPRALDIEVCLSKS